MNSRTISVPVNSPAADVYRYASNPANLPQWIRSFCLSVRHTDEGWIMQTTTGPLGIRFVPQNDFGVLDHEVTLPDGQTIYNPMRVVSNGAGSEVMFTLFQIAGMTEEQFARDADMVAADLRTLKDVMEGGPERDRK